MNPKFMTQVHLCCLHSKLKLNAPSYSQSSSLFIANVTCWISFARPASLQQHEDPLVNWAPPGTNPRDVYDSSLPWWRAAIRRKLVASVQWESEVIVQMQVSIKNSCSLCWHPNHYIGKNLHSTVRRIFRLRSTYVPRNSKHFLCLPNP